MHLNKWHLKKNYLTRLFMLFEILNLPHGPMILPLRTSKGPRTTGWEPLHQTIENCGAILSLTGTCSYKSDFMRVTRVAQKRDVCCRRCYMRRSEWGRKGRSVGKGWERREWKLAIANLELPRVASGGHRSRCPVPDQSSWLLAWSVQLLVPDARCPICRVPSWRRVLW